MNPYEIMDPAVISSALLNMEAINPEAANMTVEEIRNKLSITKIIDMSTQEIIKASMEKGVNYEYHPTEYTIKYVYDRKYGPQFGKRLLYNILKAYDSNFIEKYYKKNNTVNFLSGLNIEDNDYIDIYNQLKRNLDATIAEIGYLAESDPDYRSSRTGMSFQDI